MTTSTTSVLLGRIVENGVATFTLNHPPANLLTLDLLHELDTAFEAVANDPSIRAVVITGGGRFFVAGADIRIIAGIPSSREGTDLALQGQTILNKIEASEKPVIAAINGTCLGGGLELALCCHIRLAAEGARFGQPEINLGIIPGFGATQRLPRVVGRSKATEMILTGDLISAQDAKAAGLVSQVYTPEDLLRQAQGLARKISTKSQVAVRSALRAIALSSYQDLLGGLGYEAQLFGEVCDSEDKKEGVAAFLEKRQPQFKDR
jgi:enoyl-CoA hydratase/carnithine racemase